LKTLSLSIQDLLDDRDHGLDLTVLAGLAGLANRVETPRIQKSGLALSGYTEHLHPDRIQILGNTELSYLRQLSAADAARYVGKLCAFPITCFIITMGLEPPDCLRLATEQAGIPLLRTSHRSSSCIALVTKFLEEKLLPVTHVHGVLVDVLGVGVLILGKSGIGKSECALDLVIRGHRLVADDVVQISRRTPAALVGSATEPLQFRMEIRGLGIINIKDLFGISAIRGKKVINLAIELAEWNAAHEYDRLGIDTAYYPILDVDLPYLQIPLRYGRNLTSIIEVAARNFLLKEMGYNSTREFQENLLARMAQQGQSEEVE
jgi:HPr kinase/phosphorylase